MKRKALEKAKRKHKALRGSSARAADLIALASVLGREAVAGRGKEPTFLSRDFPDLRPLTIPKHGGKDLKTGTKNSILNQLEDDISRHEMELGEDDDEHKEQADDEDEDGPDPVGQDH